MVAREMDDSNNDDGDACFHPLRQACLGFCCDNGLWDIFLGDTCQFFYNLYLWIVKEKWDDRERL